MYEQICIAIYIYIYTDIPKETERDTRGEMQRQIHVQISNDGNSSTTFLLLSGMGSWEIDLLGEEICFRHRLILARTSCASLHEVPFVKEVCLYIIFV